MDKTVFESFEDYLEEANYPQGKKKIMQAAVDLISTRSYHGTSTLHIAERAGIFGSFFEELLAFETTEERVRYLVHDRMSYLKKNRALMKIILQESFSNKKLKNEQIFIWNAIQDKLRVLHKELLADPRVNPELTIPQMVRICVGPLLAYFAQLYIVSDNGEIKEEDLDLLEKQILGGLWR